MGLGRFGFVSAQLNFPGFWRTLAGWAPDRLLYCRGPLGVGEMSGEITRGNCRESLRGWGWKTPEHFPNGQMQEQFQGVWPKFLLEAAREDVDVIGIAPGMPVPPPYPIKPELPGLSDGKAWELLFFIHRFRNLLRSHHIPPYKAKAVVIWEEGNLGAACARLIARDLRFLTLIAPKPRLLERVADQILSESGVSSQITTDADAMLKGARIVIVCGKVRFGHLPKDLGRIIWCELFQPHPPLSAINLKIPLAVTHRKDPFPLYPALGEAIVRCKFGLHSGNWYGSELPLERVLKMDCLCKELGMEGL